MIEPNPFSDVLDAAERLNAEEQTELVAVLSKRLAERGRKRVVESVTEARRDFAAGNCRPVSAAELVQEAAS